MINALKYLVYAMTIYVLLSFIPEKKVCLVDLLLIIILIISFNFIYEFIETNKNPILEGYAPNPNERLYSDALGALDNGRSKFSRLTSEDTENTDLDPISESNPTKINSDLEDEKENIVGSLGESEIVDEPKGVSEDDTILATAKPEEITKEKPEEIPEEIQALDTSNSSNLASLELNPEDENKKDIIQYQKEYKNPPFKYGYAYMHTDFWNLPAERKPVCKNIKPCKVCPRQTTGFDKDRLQWD